MKESKIKKLSLNFQNNFYNNIASVLFFSALLPLKYFISKSTKYLVVWIFCFTLMNPCVEGWLYTLRISLSGDGEVNPDSLEFK